MEPERVPPTADPAAKPIANPLANSETELAPKAALAPEAHFPEAEEYRGLLWIFIGSQGLRAGWSVSLFFVLTVLFMMMLGPVANLFVKQVLHAKSSSFTPSALIIGELMQLLAILGAGAMVALIERRRILDYYLTGQRRIFHLLGGLAAGFATLSALVGAMAWGGWLHFGAVALSGGQIFSFAASWGVLFLLTGLFEEGAFRGYLQFTLTRGINFWWALGSIAIACLCLLAIARGNGVWGVYAAALLGLIPCLILHIRKTPRSGFWQAAWVTSTFFGLIHTGNNGENWVGIFAAALVGFLFCVSVRLTGSAWWAIGCHASWDWAETYFYGTADSGMAAKGHYLTTYPVGNDLWSGGANGPEGSLLILPILLLLLVAILVIYGREKSISFELPDTNRAAG